MKIHRILGWISPILIILIIVGGIQMMQLMIAGQDRYPPDVVYNLAFIDALTLIGFAILYGLALIYRKNIKLHARFMVCTIFGPLVPALTRVFFTLGWASSFDQGLNLTYITAEVVLLLIISLEHKHKEIWWTYIPVLIFMVIQHLIFRFPNGWKWWVNMMDGFAGM